MKNKKLVFLFLCVALIVVALGALFIGATGLPSLMILKSIRLPRVLLGLIVGAGLAASGALLQGILRNPLADPYVLGTSSGAALGGILAFELKKYLGWQNIFLPFLYYGVIFIGAFLATVLAYWIAQQKRQVPIVNLILSGVILNSFSGALIFLYFTLQQKDSFSVFFFLMGSLTEGNWSLIAWSGAIVIVGCVLTLALAKTLDVLALGEEKAHHLGISVERFKFIVFAVSALVVSACVAVSGPIGFVGLVVPHILRFWVGPNHKVLLPASILGGAILLIAMDALARVVAAPIEIPVGIMMGLLGAPFFLWLLKRKKDSQFF